MTGQINVNKIAARSGTTITIDTGDALDVTLVKGEGTNTTNLKQGLAKMWGVVDQTSTHVIDDSFNLGTVTDNGTGRTQFNFTNNMNNSTYCVLATKRDGNGYNDEMSVHSDEDGAYDSEKFELVGMNGSSANDADGALWTAVMGDLA